MAGEIQDESGAFITDEAGQAITDENLGELASSGVICMKKMRVAISAEGISVAEGIPRLKNMQISSSGKGISVASGVVRANKFLLSSEIPPDIPVSPYSPPKIDWDTTGERIFETGIDRGMFYLPAVPGVPWNGLVQVSENATGGTAREFYLDGDKYLNLPSLEEYSATIQAFSSPLEFAPCDGYLRISPGLYAGNQPRKSFGFSYRTLVGSDTEGLEAGYKIHLVYGVIAKSDNFANQSVTNSPGVKPYSWTISSLPQEISKFKAASHFVVDSRNTDPVLLNLVESILYGTEMSDPRLPTPQELLIALKIETSQISVGMTTHKMRISGTGIGRSVVTGAVTQNKMIIYGLGGRVADGNGDVKLKKMRIFGTGTISASELTAPAELLPYLIATNAIGTGTNTIVLTTGANGGWPALPGDTIVACGGSGNAYPTGITDLRGNSYTRQSSTLSTPVSSVWTAVDNGGGLQTATGPRGVADTFTVTYELTGQAKQWIIFGCSNLGTRDLAVSPTNGNSNAPSITSGPLAVAGELVVVTVLHTNAAGTINTPAGWHVIAKNITSGVNALASVFVKQVSNTSAVTFTAALTNPSTWTCQMTTFRPALIPLKGKIGSNIFAPSYPGLNLDNWEAHLRFDAVTGRTHKVVKRYCKEDDSAASALNDIEAIVGTYAANGMEQIICAAPRRAIGGGIAAGITWLRDSITYWKNNAVKASIILGNESNINGLHGAFGDGSTHDWALPCPYSAVTAEEAAQNYKDYFAYYGPTVISSGCECYYDPSMSSEGTVITFLPSRLQADGWPLLSGVAIDTYGGDYFKIVGGQKKGITLDGILAACDAMNPPCPAGLAEWGSSASADYLPLEDNPPGTLEDMVSWMDNEITAKFASRPVNGFRNLPICWFSNGTTNALDYDADPRILAAYRRMCDALNSE